MGIALSCVAKDIDVDRLDLDMTQFKERNLPVIWISGQQNTGKKTHGNLIQDKYKYDHISTSELLRLEATKDTDRGRMIKDALSLKKKIPDDVVIDLLKEALVSSTNERGYVISNFPKNAKQAEMFIKEIGNVTFVLHLYSDTNCLIGRAQERSTEVLNEDILKRDIMFASRDIRLSLIKFAGKVENINTHDAPDSVFENIERTFVDRLRIGYNNPPIVAETDYVRQPNNLND